MALPIFEAAFGPRGSQPAVPSGSGFTNGTFITQLQQGQAGRLANTLAGAGGDARYLCAMVGNALPACTSRGYNVAGTVSRSTSSRPTRSVLAPTCAS